MGKFNIREADPVRYAKVKAEQEAVKMQCEGKLTLVRVCPYCKHKVSEVVKGNHGYAFTKCDKCGEDITFPPVSFRLAK